MVYLDTWVESVSDLQRACDKFTIKDTANTSFFDTTAVFHAVVLQLLLFCLFCVLLQTGC